METTFSAGSVVSPTSRDSDGSDTEKEAGQVDALPAGPVKSVQKDFMMTNALIDICVNHVFMYTIFLCMSTMYTQAVNAVVIRYSGQGHVRKQNDKHDTVLHQMQNRPWQTHGTCRHPQAVGPCIVPLKTESVCTRGHQGTPAKALLLGVPVNHQLP